MIALVTLSLVAGAVLVALLSFAADNTAFLAEYFTLLLALTGVVALALVGLIGYQGYILLRRIRAGVFGARLTARLLLVFVLMAVLPGAIVYAVSVQFLTRSIESWFDVRMERALQGGLNLGQSALEHVRRDLVKKAEGMANQLAELPLPLQTPRLNELREAMVVQEAGLYDIDGRLLGFASGDKMGFAPLPPSSAAIWQVRLQQPWSRVEPTPDGEGLIARAAVPVNVLALDESIRVLYLAQPIPLQLARDAREVGAAHSSYQELALSRIGLKRLYGFSLTLALALALFSAISLAFILSERMAAPLRALARGTRAVARGDFSQVQAAASQDELGMLTQSFNRMTRQLADARSEAQNNQDMLQEAKAYLESILGSVSTGVITLSPDYVVRTVNAAAAQALGVAGADLAGHRLSELGEPGSGLAAVAAEMERSFAEAEGSAWQGEMEFDSGHGLRVLLARGAPLTGEADSDRLLAFDDITELIRAQRDAAWGEVARRLAHEIKNPLTPIRLSAERMQRKLADKLDDPSRQILTRATETIVGQVGAMKSLVDAFAEYAKLPTARIEAIDLNALVQEVLVLYEGQVPMQVMLEDGLPKVAGDPTLLRQVLHNLVKNAKEALGETAEPQLRVGTGRGLHGVELRIGDNGPGFPEHLLRRLFEPYATTKPKGTGLGLTIVKKIVDEHGGMIDVRNAQPHGACITITLPLMESDATDE